MQLLDNLFDTLDRLRTRSYAPATPTCFVAEQPKAREIHAARFDDRVVHHWLVPRLARLYEPIFIHDLYSNREGKGTHAAVKRLQDFMRKLGPVGAACSRDEGTLVGAACSRDAAPRNKPLTPLIAVENRFHSAMRGGADCIRDEGSASGHGESRLQAAPTGRVMKKPKPHSSDLRKGRVSEPGRLYHVRGAVEGRRAFFADLHLGREVVKSMRFLHERGDVQSLAFVVMPDHFHWLFELGEGPDLEGVMRSLKRHTAREINRRLGRTGQALWQPGYYDRALRKEEDQKALARYIVANPLRAGICENIGDYSLWDAIWL